MSKRHKQRATQETQAAERLLSIRRSVALLNEEDDIPPGLFTHVEWFVTRGLEQQLHDLLEGPTLSEIAAENLGFVLSKVGYRLAFLAKTDQRPTPEEYILMPFAILFSAMVLPGTQLLMAMSKVTYDVIQPKLLRETLALDEGIGVFLDPHLYRVDLPEWRKESVVQRYLKSLRGAIAQATGFFTPLTKDFSSPDRPTASVVTDPGAETFSVITRVLIGAVYVPSDKIKSTEDKLFLCEEEPKYSFDKIAELLQRELTAQLGPVPEVAVAFHPIELGDVPPAGGAFRRMAEIDAALSTAVESLRHLSSIASRAPVLYVSTHGTDGTVDEIRIAAYPSDKGGEAFFFSYVWEINEEFESAEDVTDEIARIAGALHATILQVDGLLPDERCACCEKKTFHGPGNAATDAPPRREASPPKHLLN